MTHFRTLRPSPRRRSGWEQVHTAINSILCLWLCGLDLLWTGGVHADDAPAVAVNRSPWAEIHVVDSVTRRGVPLVELETVHGVRFVTDNNGRIAIIEPDLLGRDVFFSIRSHGYQRKADGFGFTGIRLTPRPGETTTIEVPRTNIAERLCRLTGEGRYRDTQLLGGQPADAPVPDPGRVAGQDSIQSVVYRNRIYWFWGDTNRLEYPLGLYRMAGATTALPDPGDDFDQGFAYDYFTDPQTGFARAMMPLPERRDGVIWIDAVFTLRDDSGRERLLGHYSRREGLTKELEQGLAVYNDDRDLFEPIHELPLTEAWRRPQGHPILEEEQGERRLYFGSPTPNVRVAARWSAVLDPTQYEAFSCAKEDGSGPLIVEGQPAWRWQKSLPPTDSRTEHHWVKQNQLAIDQTRFLPVDALHAEEQVVLHNGTVRWNEYRKRWVLLAGQIFGKPSFMGEVWYAEAPHPTGPFRKAVRVVTHNKQTFYNVCQHGFLDRSGGRLIHFEGTYTHEFSGNPDRTPRYDYNQILYRLDLEHPDLAPARSD